MGLIKKKLFLFLLIFQVFSVNSQLLDPQFGKLAPPVASLIIPNCLGFGQKTLAECRIIMISETDLFIANYGDQVTARMSSRGDITFTQTDTALNSSKPTWIEYFYTNPDRWVKYSQSAKSQYAQVVTLEVPQCPDPQFTDYKVPRYIDINANQVLYCFNQTDLNFRDSCPDSTQDGGYVLPVTAINTEPTMCLDKPDGSMCKYKQVGDVYVTDFENNCYELNGAPRFDESGIIQPDPTISTCQLLGQGVSACIEDPFNVCDSQGNCNTGCGSVAFGDSQPLFVCLSGDTDGDGLANYLDPDIDGDGIRNEVDLDSNGDGIDDAKILKPAESMNVSLNLGNMETLQAQGNTSLSEIKGLLEQQNGSSPMPAYSTILNSDTVNQSIVNRIGAAPVSLALSGMATAINFNTEGSCPELSFYLPSPIDKTVSTSTHCSMMPAMRLVITPVMFAIYLFMAFRIFAAA
jgi:hypothetical protein